MPVYTKAAPHDARGSTRGAVSFGSSSLITSRSIRDHPLPVRRRKAEAHRDAAHHTEKRHAAVIRPDDKPHHQPAAPSPATNRVCTRAASR